MAAPRMTYAVTLFRLHGDNSPIPMLPHSGGHDMAVNLFRLVFLLSKARASVRGGPRVAEVPAQHRKQALYISILCSPYFTPIPCL